MLNLIQKKFLEVSVSAERPLPLNFIAFNAKSILTAKQNHNIARFLCAKGFLVNTSHGFYQATNAGRTYIQTQKLQTQASLNSLFVKKRVLVAQIASIDAQIENLTKLL